MQIHGNYKQRALQIAVISRISKERGKFEGRGSFHAERVEIKEGRINYLAFIKATVVSNILLEKPHSLSYQDSTFTNVPPVTLVKLES